MKVNRFVNKQQDKQASFLGETRIMWIYTLGD
jgi:hypothetical protein